MDFVFWIILIVLIVGVVWWLLNRSNSAKVTGDGGRAGAGPAASAEGPRADGALAGGSAAASAEAAGTAGIATAAGFGRPSEPVPPTTADETPELSEPSGSGPAAEQTAAPERMEPEPAAVSEVPSAAPPQPAAGNGADVTSAPTPREVDDATAAQDAEAVQGRGSAQGTEGAPAGRDDQFEWDTQWSEAGGSPVHHTSSATAAPAGPADGADTAASVEDPAAQHTSGGQPALVHHPEYTAPHSPTLPGAESAAAEAEIDGPAEPAVSSTADSGSSPEPAGLLAADRPYGEGSASPSPDGSGPADYTVKGDAGAMIYYEEGHPEYEQTRAGVWFESAAHAEAAGFRAPRRTRLQ